MNHFGARLPWQEVRRSVSIRCLAGELGLRPAKEADKYACVWCTSSNALHLYADGAYCFSCGTRGSVIDVAAAAWRTELADACRRLGQRLSIQPPLREPATPADPRRDREATRRRVEVLGDLPELLQLNPEAQSYLEGRGLDARYAADYGVRSIMGLEEFEAMKGELVARHGREAWQTAGLASWWKSWPLLTLPYWSAAGVIVACRARSARPAPGRPKYVSPKGGGPGIPFNLEALDALHAPDSTPERVIVCEGELDALLLHQLGECAVGLPGASPSGRLLERLVEALSNAPRIAIATDPDEAGRRAAKQLAGAFLNAYGREWVRLRVELWEGSGDVTETLLGG